MTYRSLFSSALTAGLIGIAAAASAQQTIVDTNASAESGDSLFGVTASGDFGLSGSSLVSGGSGVMTAMSSDAATSTTGTTGTTSTTNN
ncbi:hypothetical protein [Albibacillus kandeliae]|uniref:hypothetical protein n=1 Tax=Albibacillus kandeliae TaxID=2174228 RepID=UPI000D686D43|nr:hypothetical protein [Albibacillus kandeliae]